MFFGDSVTERNYTEIGKLLSKASEELSDKMKLRRLLKAMYTDDKFEGMEEFSEILSSLSPELVSFQITDISVRIESYLIQAMII